VTCIYIYIYNFFPMLIFCLGPKMDSFPMSKQDITQCCSIHIFLHMNKKSIRFLCLRLTLHNGLLLFIQHISSVFREKRKESTSGSRKINSVARKNGSGFIHFNNRLQWLLLGRTRKICWKSVVHTSKIQNNFSRYILFTWIWGIGMFGQWASTKHMEHYVYI